MFGSKTPFHLKIELDYMYLTLLVRVYFLPYFPLNIVSSCSCAPPPVAEYIYHTLNSWQFCLITQLFNTLFISQTSRIVILPVILARVVPLRSSNLSQFQFVLCCPALSLPIRQYLSELSFYRNQRFLLSEAGQRTHQRVCPQVPSFCQGH